MPRSTKPSSKSKPPAKPPKRPRAETAAETREALIQAGMELFAEHGLDASLDAICARAGKTRGAFYVHFPERDAFLEAVMDRAGTRYLDATVGEPGAAPDFGAIVKRFVASVKSGDYPLTRDSGPRPHQLLEACARSPAVRARYVTLIERALATLSGALASGREASLVRPDLEPKIGARLLLAAVIGAQTMLELGIALDVPRSAAQLMTLLAPARTAPPGPATTASVGSKPRGKRTG